MLPLIVKKHESLLLEGGNSGLQKSLNKGEI